MLDTKINMDNALTQATDQQIQPTPEETLAATNQALIKKKKTQPEPVDDMAAISTASAMLNPNSKEPQVQVGKAVATPAYAGLCLKWVDDQQGSKNRLPTAYADYQARAQVGAVKQSEDAPQGARVYFAPDKSNGNMGHVGISLGDGKFRSATDNGIKDFSIKEWEKFTGQKFIGYSPS